MRQIEDEILIDLIHESIHARAPFDRGHEAETPWRGYEESAVEIRSRALARQAGFTPQESAYRYWVTALETLAEALGVSADRLAQELLTHPNGTLRGQFSQTIERVRGSALSAAQKTRLEKVGDEVFDFWRFDKPVTQAVRSGLNDRWRNALK